MIRASYEEDLFWREMHQNLPSFDDGYDRSHWQPAASEQASGEAGESSGSSSSHLHRAVSDFFDSSYQHLDPRDYFTGSEDTLLDSSHTEDAQGRIDSQTPPSLSPEEIESIAKQLSPYPQKLADGGNLKQLEGSTLFQTKLIAAGLNSQFEAISYAIYEQSNLNSLVKLRILSWLEDKSQDTRLFAAVGNPNTYIQEIHTGKKMPDELTLYAASQTFNKRIILVYIDSRNSEVLSHVTQIGKKSQKDVIALTVRDGHYQVLYTCSDG
ncbi:hypothetical protein O181_036681 [Austropuccinia psidii MF-1]|uniref:Uncharacterized protein n=1 Tax=Austropuccinia psidii MF-1 TaxID=1389203 RepID=A0A9Q3D4V5_9BASI|nr:hypothetical protein [Austropuccinia psidii MF-1]